MSKPSEATPGEIPKNEWKEELEKEVDYYTALAGPQRRVTKKYTTNIQPTKFADKREEDEYKLEEIRRLVNGYDGLCGKMYGWLHYAKIRDPERGKISPDFRTRDLAWFEKVEENQKSRGRGIVKIKRRRCGASQKAAWDAEHDCMTTPYFQIGMNSKSENDSRNLFKNVKFIHQNLPDWLRPTATASDRRDYMEFAYWWDKTKNKMVSQNGMNCEKRGLQSWISSVAPTDTAHEGQAYSKLIIDEAGKIVNLTTLWGYAEDCLRINTRRVGLPIIFGTVGDIDKDGRGLMDMWINNEAYLLDRFAYYGYHGLMCDEYGNDRVPESIRWIIYERERLKAAHRKVRDAFVQKYPLCDADAFNHISSGGVGDIQLINAQIFELMSNPVEKRIGWMRRKPEGGVDFVPNPEGKVIIYEPPDHARQNGYTATVDPAEDDGISKNRDASELALTIMAKPYGLEPPKLVVEYADRPMKIDSFFEQTAMVLEWYNKTKVHIELNKGGWRMLKYFEQYYQALLALAPRSANSARKGVELKHGVKMTEDKKQQMMGLLEDLIDNYSKFIPSIKFLEQCKVFGDDHKDDDVAVSVGWNLIIMQGDKSVVKNINTPISDIPQVIYKKQNGVIQYINQGSSTQKPKFNNGSVLFRR